MIVRVSSQWVCLSLQTGPWQQIHTMHSSEVQTPPTSPPSSKPIDSADSPSKLREDSDTSKPTLPPSSESPGSAPNMLDDKCRKKKRKRTQVDFALPSDGSCQLNPRKKSKALLMTVEVVFRWPLNNANIKSITRSRIRTLQTLKTSVPSVCCSLPEPVGRHSPHTPSTSAYASKKLKLCV